MPFGGVKIPAAGTYDITYNYWPQYFTLALWLALIGVMGLLGGLIWLFRSKATFA